MQHAGTTTDVQQGIPTTTWRPERRCFSNAVSLANLIAGPDRMSGNSVMSGRHTCPLPAVDHLSESITMSPPHPLNRPNTDTTGAACWYRPSMCHGEMALSVGHRLHLAYGNCIGTAYPSAPQRPVTGLPDLRASRPIFQSLAIVTILSLPPSHPNPATTGPVRNRPRPAPRLLIPGDSGQLGHTAGVPPG